MIAQSLENKTKKQKNKTNKQTKDKIEIKF